MGVTRFSAGSGVGARVSWEDAGGSEPSFGGVYNTDTAGVAPGLGVDPVILSKFSRIGKECFATCRIHAGASGTTAGEGYITLEGLPVRPNYVGAGADGGQKIGDGFILNPSTFQFYPLWVVMDPYYSTTAPVFFVPQTVSGGNWAPTSFAGDPLPLLHGAGTYPTYGALSASPLSLASEYRLNVTLQYEGV